VSLSRPDTSRGDTAAGIATAAAVDNDDDDDNLEVVFDLLFGLSSLLSITTSSKTTPFPPSPTAATDFDTKDLSRLPVVVVAAAAAAAAAAANTVVVVVVDVCIFVELFEGEI
jgi:hypothetical protein